MLRKCALLVLVLFALVGVLQVYRAQGLDSVTLETGILPLAAIVVATVAVAIAVLAMRGARRVQADFTRLSRSMEMALRELASRSDRGAASLDEFNRRIGEELRSLRTDAELRQDRSRTGPEVSPELTAAGFRLAVEGWEGDAAELAQAKSRGVQFLKLPANRLLDRERMRRKAPTGPELAEAAAAAGIAIIATGVIRDDDAVNLIDLGIDLMEGERFSGPRRIRSRATREATPANL